MKSFDNLLEKKNTGELILVILFIIYLISRKKMSFKMAQMVDLPLIKLSIIGIALVLFFYSNKILGVLAIFVAYEIISESNDIMREDILYDETEEIEPKNTISVRKKFKPTLEQDIVFTMQPIVGINSFLDKPSYTSSYTDVFGAKRSDTSYLL